MDLNSERIAIAAAVSTVDGISCTPNYRQITRPGDAYVRLSNLTRSGNNYDFMNTWQIWLAIPQDEKAGEQYIDANIDALVTAISPELIITSVTPAEMTMGANSINGVIIEGAR